MVVSIFFSIIPNPIYNIDPVSKAPFLFRPRLGAAERDEEVLQRCEERRASLAEFGVP